MTVSPADKTKATIVVGVNGSDRSLSALWWACGEASRLDGRVVAVYVSCIVTPGLAAAASAGVDSPTYMDTRHRVESERAQRVREQVRSARAELHADLEFVHAHGDTAEQLMRAAEELGADMVAVGRSAKSWHRLAGSLGRKLTRERGVPIIVIVP